MLEQLVIAKTGRLPLPDGPHGNAGGLTRQLDSTLMTVGFKLSGDLLARLSLRAPHSVVELSRWLLPAVREMVGDHVEHNVYFRDFPDNVPDTLEFWTECIRDALLDEKAAPEVEAQLSMGVLNLLSLPKYGSYQHDYDELLAAHAEFMPLASDRVTVIELGGPLEDELSALYLALAGSTTPLSEDDLQALRLLAEHCASGTQPDDIPIRENRALINQVRLAHGRDLLVDTVTDILRLACALSDGDVTLQEPTKFRSFRRPERRALLAALDTVVLGSRAKLGDVGAHREPWKRLGERLHPHEYPQWPQAMDVFAVARREKTARSFASRIEAAFAGGDFAGALALHLSAPGLLFRSLDRLLRAAGSEADQDAIVDAVETTVGKVSGRVILSVREHLQNRVLTYASRRVFANRLGRAWVADDTRGTLDGAVVERLNALLDAEIKSRLPQIGHLVVDPDFLDVALPISGKADPSGFGILPRGSATPIDGRLLRFFVYWKEKEVTTDFDLSALMLDADYTEPEWLSYTSLTGVGGEHSGDITSAPDGASEFINLRLGKVSKRVIIPQVNIYSGEGFHEVEESFFGYMLRDREQHGLPFEPRTVRMKSDLRGPNRVALPMAFVKDDDGWRAVWMHLFLRGHAAFNEVEGNRVSTTELVRGIVEREYLTVQYLVDLLEPAELTLLDGPMPEGEVTYLGFETLGELKKLIPA